MGEPVKFTCIFVVSYLSTHEARPFQFYRTMNLWLGWTSAVRIFSCDYFVVYLLWRDTCRNQMRICSSCDSTSLAQNTIRFMETRTHTYTHGWYSGDGLNRHECVLGHCRDMPADTLPLKTSCWLCSSHQLSSSLFVLTLLFKSAWCCTFSHLHQEKMKGTFFPVQSILLSVSLVCALDLS